MRGAEFACGYGEAEGVVGGDGLEVGHLEGVAERLEVGDGAEVEDGFGVDVCPDEVLGFAFVFGPLCFSGVFEHGEDGLGVVRFGGRGEGRVGQVDDCDVGVLHVASVGVCLVTLVVSLGGYFRWCCIPVLDWS